MDGRSFASCACLQSKRGIKMEAYKNKNLSYEERAKALLLELSLEERIYQVS